MNWRTIIPVALLLAVAGFFLFEFMLHRHSEIFREYEAALFSLQYMVMGCLALWCAGFLWLSFGWQDLPLIGLLPIVIGFIFLGHAVNPSRDALTLLAGVTLGRGVKLLLSRSSRREEALNINAESGKRKAKMSQSLLTSAATFLMGLVGLLTFAAWWHLDMSDNYYHGSRWMGLWDNPNTYGMLMGAGGLLAIGLLARIQKSEFRIQKSGRDAQSLSLRIILFIATAMMSVGLIMSYSRGAWLATGIALVYLVGCYGKLKCRYVGIGAGCVALGAGLLWGSTADSAPWYVKRADLGRPSAQHRATAWRAGLEMMRDHPLGVGWNNAVSLYDKSYSPPEGGAPAITTNDYMMLGTELGIPALLCFVVYVALCYRKSPRIQKLEVRSQKQSSAGVSPAGEGQISPAAQTGGTPILLWQEQEALRAACLAGALVFVVAFWFDGGLFKLPTAALFWVLLELGAYRPQISERGGGIGKRPAATGWWCRGARTVSGKSPARPAVVM